MRLARLTLVLILVASAGAAASPVEITIAPFVEKAVLSPAEASLLRFTITNTTDQEVAYLRYNTPIGGFESDLFSVELDGEHVTYIGRMVLRLGPTPDSWIVLAPGETLEAVVDLAEAYDMRRGGRYEVSFRAPIGLRGERKPLALSPEKGTMRVEELAAELSHPIAPELPTPEYQVDVVTSNSLELLVDGPAEVFEDPDPLLHAMGYSGCTTSQQSSISYAKSSGRTLSAKSYNQLTQTSGSSNSLYRTWFGTYTSSRYSTVRYNYYDIYYAFGRTWNQTCTSCESGVIAYVYPTSAYNVWICPDFFKYGTTTRGSFLLHEASHWNAVAGTDDYGYGSSFCQSLARSNPGAAVWNADNYRYFSLYAP